MKPPEVALREFVYQWLEKASADFVAEQLCEPGGRFREIAAFHRQQAVEKYLKALLVRARSNSQRRTILRNCWTGWLR
jgi:HEPN domain-containing protein